MRAFSSAKFINLVLILGLSLTFVVSSSLSNQKQNQTSATTTTEHQKKHKVNYRYLCLAEGGEGMKTEKHLGIACRCPSIYAPVCGSDNNTYHNRCVLHCKAKHATDLYQKYRLVLKKFGEC